MRGKIVSFNAKKGYGFLRREEGGKDVFVHYTEILMDGYRTLDPGDIVEFEVAEGPKGAQASKVRKVS